MTGRKKGGLETAEKRLSILTLIVLLLVSVLMPQTVFADLPNADGGGNTSDGYGQRWDGIDFESMIGDGIYYGTYDHWVSSSTYDGTPTPILWRAMGEENDGRLTLMSEYILDRQKFTHKTGWGDQGTSNFAVSNLRIWLNTYTYTGGSGTIYSGITVTNGFLYSFGSDADAAEYKGLATDIVTTRLFDRYTGSELIFPNLPGYWNTNAWVLYYTNARFPYELGTKVYLPWGHYGGVVNSLIGAPVPNTNIFPHANSGKLYWDAAQSENDDYLIGTANQGEIVATTKNGTSTNYWTQSGNAYVHTGSGVSYYAPTDYAFYVDATNDAISTAGYTAQSSLGVRPIVKLIPENIIFVHEISETATGLDQVQADKEATGIWNYTTSENGGTNYKLTILNSSLTLDELYLSGSIELDSGDVLPFAPGETLTLNSSNINGDYLAYKIVYDDGTTRSIVSYGTNKDETDQEVLVIKQANNIANANNFNSGGDYTLYVWTQQEVSGIRSFEGSDTWYFPLGVPDSPGSAGPEVVDASPNGTSVLITADTASITFSEEMNTSAGAMEIVALDNDAELDLVNGTWSTDNKTITYNLSNLTYSTTYTFTVSGFKDVSGNPMVTPHSVFNFTTKSAPPNVTAVTPNGTGISITADAVSISFDKEMNAGVIGTVSLDNGALLTGGTWSNTNQTITYVLSNLDYSTTYTYTITGFEDMDENVMAIPNPAFNFTTKSAPPNVAVVTPNGTGIPIAADTVSITFDKEMNTSAGFPGTVSLNNGAVLDIVNGTWSIDNKTITYNLSNLTYSTTYTYTITGFEDTDGNVMVIPNPAFNFTTENDLIQPEAIDASPNGTSIAVSTNKASITFNEPMNASAGFPGTVTLDNGAVLNPESGTWSNSNQTITFDLSNLTFSTTYTFAVSGFEDEAGNVMITPHAVFNFTTTADIIPPNAVDASPNGSGVSISTSSASITFDKEMNKSAPGTVTLDNGAELNMSSGTWSADNKTITYDLSNLTYLTIYTFTVSGFKDTAGNNMVTPHHIFNFTTEPDLIQPNAISATPNGSNISITANSASITFDKRMDTSVIGTVALDNGGILNMSSAVWSNDDKTVTYTLSNLTYSTTYNYSISGFKDTAGNLMVTPHQTFDFTTEPDKTKPVAISAVPGGENIAITTDFASISFNKEMNTTAGLGTVTLNNGATLSGGTWSSDKKTITYTLSGLDYSTTYTFSIKNFEDTAGNTMVTPHQVFNFKTAPDTVQPIAVSASPSGMNVSVGTGTASITFNKEMNASAGFPGTVTLDNSASLAGGTWSNNNQTITYTLSGLDYSTTYTFDVKDFEDTFGNTMVIPHAVFNFTTEKNLIAPSVIRVTPNGTGIAVSTNSVSISFDKEMDTSVSGTVTLDNGAVLANGVWTDSRTITYDLSNLNYSTTYTYTIAGFEDSNNILMNTPIPDFTFQTVNSNNTGGGGSGGGTVVDPDDDEDEDPKDDDPEQPGGTGGSQTEGTDDDQMGGYEEDLPHLPFIVLLYLIAVATFCFCRNMDKRDDEDRFYLTQMNNLI